MEARHQAHYGVQSTMLFGAFFRFQFSLFRDTYSGVLREMLHPELSFFLPCCLRCSILTVVLCTPNNAEQTFASVHADVCIFTQCDHMIITMNPGTMC